MLTPKIYIVILNYRNWQDTRDCLHSVLRSGYTNFSVLLVDNNSMNDSLENLGEWLMRETDASLPHGKNKFSVIKKENLSGLARPSELSKITFIQNDRNAGFAGGNNIALRLLQNEEAYIWLLNPDTVIPENTLDELVQFTIKQPSDCIVGAAIRANSGSQDLLFYGGGKVNFFSATVHPVKKPVLIPNLDYISGACLFTHAANFKKLGLLHEEYFLYWEETDWCYRAKQRGFRLLVCSSAVCYDKISSSIGKGYLADYYYSRNGLLFLSKFRRRNMAFAVLFMTVRFWKRVITGRWGKARGVFKGTLDFFKKKYYEAQ